MQMTLKQLRQTIVAALVEGGLKLPPKNRIDLTPQLVKQASNSYLEFIKGWNSWLQKQGVEPVVPEGPSGSSIHADKDLADRPETIYGDVDYLVSFPVEYESNDLGNKRKADATSERKYTDLLAQYIKTTRPNNVDIELSLKGSPLQVIMKLSNDVLVQVDTTVTHPEHAQWMKGRYTPERGIKGYVTGNLYKALGDVLTLTIGTEGVLARVKDDKRVPSNVRAGVGFKRVSNSFETFLVDIARFLAGSDVKLSSVLVKHPGLDPNNVSIDDLASGIVGLSQTLDDAGIYDQYELLTQVLQKFKTGMDENVEKKADRDLDPTKLEKLKHLNHAQYKRVQNIFAV